MGSVPIGLAADLKDGLSLERAVETGTYVGDGARALSNIFPFVVSIELSEELHRQAREALADRANVRLIAGDSRHELARLAQDHTPTLYFLDAHWSTGRTAGADNQCPVLDEISAIREGDPRDCLIIDDARLFAAPPGPPHQAEQWPTLLEVLDSIRDVRPAHYVTVLRDLVIAAPAQMKPAIDFFGQNPENGLEARAPVTRRARIRARALWFAAKLRRRPA